MTFGDLKCVVIRTAKATVEERGHYDAVRFAWYSPEGIEKFQQAEYVLHPVAGTIEKVYKPAQWFDGVNCQTPGFEVFAKYGLPVKDKNPKAVSRVGFIGEEVTDKSITSQFVGQFFDQGKYPVFFSW